MHDHHCWFQHYKRLWQKKKVWKILVHKCLSYTCVTTESFHNLDMGQIEDQETTFTLFKVDPATGEVLQNSSASQPPEEPTLPNDTPEH